MPEDDSPSSSSGISSDEGPSDRDWDDWGEGDGQGGDAKALAAAIANSDDDDDETATPSLFDSSTVLPSVSAALAHDAEKHGFDLLEFRKKLSLDDYGTFRVVNFIRSEVAAGRDPKPALAEATAAAEKKTGEKGAAAAASPWDDDAFLVPVNPDDPLLFYEYEEEEDEEDAARRQGGGGGDAAAAAGPSCPEPSSSSAPAALRAENEALRSALAALAAASLPPEAAAALPAPIVEALRGVGWGGGSGAGGEASGDGDDEEESSRGTSRGALLLLKKKRGTSGKGSGDEAAPRPPSSSQEKREKEVDDAYFDSYGGLGIHREMLSDEARTGAYRRALEENPSLMKGATVLDVGAGTGVLSLFAARGGARAVVAVEASERVAALARENALANGFGPLTSSISGSSGYNDEKAAATTKTTVTVVNARVEDIERLPLATGDDDRGKEESGKVDVLVSEWMGYALFFECMLDSVILARDRFLKKKGGAILPDRATVSIAGVSPQASDLSFWADVHGLDLSPCAREARRHRERHGAVVPVEPAHLVTTEAQVHELDLLTCRVGDEAFSTTFELRALESSSPSSPEAAAAAAAAAAFLGGIALWFDVEFSERACPDSPVLLSTSPRAPRTHWFQALLELAAPMELASSSSSSSPPPPPRAGGAAGEHGEGEEGGRGGGGEEGRRKRASSAVCGRVSLSRGPCHRSVDVALELQGFDSEGNAVPGTRHVGLYPFAMSD